MELNADFSRRAAVHAAQLPWVSSPTPGVERRMLDRIGEEMARATSIVRYAPGNLFPRHTHGGGEEFLVLEGIFQDEHGDFPAGSYVRNPPGSGPGCVIFVKLWQFDPADRTEVRIDTSNLSCLPASARIGVEVMPLFQDGREEVRLERWAPGAEVAVPVAGGIEMLILDGGFSEGGEEFRVQSWLRLPAGAMLRATAGPRGCRLWVKSGHLAGVPSTPPAPSS